MEAKIKTPEYWNDEFFQPLVKAKTVNGNEVMIPKLFEKAWHGMEIQVDSLLKVLTVEEIVTDISPERISFRRIISRDMNRVFFEVWKENSQIETQIIERYLKR